MFPGAGAAGAWVVRGEVLYGVIIAVYENEPFALMMTAERLFGSVLGSAFSIRSVELWDGGVPDALKAPNVANDKTAAPPAVPKEVVLVNSKPRSKTTPETGDEGDVGESSKPNNTNGESTESVSKTKSEATQTDEQCRSTEKATEGTQTDDAPCPPAPRTAEGGTQTEDSRSPNTESATRESATRESAADRSTQAVKHDANSFSSRAGARPSASSHTVSKASDVTMSGAVQTEDPPVSRDRRSTVRSGGSASANENYITPQSTASTGPDRNFGVTTEISSGRPRTDNADDSLRDDGGSRNPNSGKGGSRSRRNSLQLILDKTFRRSSSRGGPEYNKDNNYGIPPTGLDGKPTILGKRYSSTADSSRPAAGDRKSSHGIPPTGLDDSGLNVFRRWSSGKAAPAEPEQANKDNNYGIPPTGLDDKLKMFKRQSLSRKSQEPERLDKDNNFGIPPGGL